MGLFGIRNGHGAVSPTAKHGSHGARGNGAVATGPLDARGLLAPASGTGARYDETAPPSIVLTHDGWTVGHLVHSQPRVLDALASPVLVLKTARDVRVIERDDVLLVVPPPLTEVSFLRVAKQPIPVSVDIGIATLRGQIHVVPGASPWETWQRSTSGFVAVTGAVLDFPDGTSETADVVLVSRHAAHAGLLDD